MKEHDDFVWLELKPQQKFKDDDKNSIFEIIEHVSEFAFFVICKGCTMRIVVRVGAGEQGIFRTIPGLSAEQTGAPQLENMAARCIAPKGRSIAPLIDLETVTKGNMYQKMWAQRQDSVMACFVSNQTSHILGRIRKKISSLEGAKALTSGKKAELAAAIKKRDGHHGHYNCLIAFGTDQESSGADSRIGFLDRLIGGVMLNSFAHRISRRSIRFSSKKKGSWQKILDMLGVINTVDPYTFVPRRIAANSMVLTGTELAFFISFPQEYDIQTINFGIGPTPTFVHGTTQEVGSTDLVIDENSKASQISRGSFKA